MNVTFSNFIKSIKNRSNKIYLLETKKIRIVTPRILTTKYRYFHDPKDEFDPVDIYNSFKEFIKPEQNSKFLKFRFVLHMYKYTNFMTENTVLKPMLFQKESAKIMSSELYYNPDDNIMKYFEKETIEWLSYYNNEFDNMLYIINFEIDEI